MNNCFPLDFIRQIIEQTLLEQKLIAPTDYFGGKNEVNLFSFYEQLQKDSEVNRYVEIYNDLVEQQNRSGLIMNGTIIAPENPTITNLYQDIIIPMTFTCSFRVKLGDRDMAISTINNLIKKLKGRKQDIALFDNGQLFKVGTMCNVYNENEDRPNTHSGDYIGEWDEDFSLDSDITINIQPRIEALGIGFEDSNYAYYYLGASESGGMIVAQKVPTTTNGTTTWSWKRVYEGDTHTENIIFPPSGVDFEKYKVSMSFDSLRCDEPRTLNAEEYCTISFGGSATLVNNGVALGNDLVKLGIVKNRIIANPIIVITENINYLYNATWVEPLEMPSGNSANTIANILNSNKFNTNSHTTNITIANQYSFVVDRSIPLLDQLYKYARYGYFGVQYNESTETYDYSNAITPNMIFRIFEVNSSWGEVEVNSIDAKIVEDISIENTESDTLSMTLTFQKQGGSENIGGESGGGSGETTDYVSVDTDQTITGKKTFTNQVVFTNTLSNGTYTYTLPLESGRLATREWVNAQDFATKTWTQNQGYITSSALSGYATQTWVQNQGYLTSVSLVGYATETWVSNNFATANTWRPVNVNSTSFLLNNDSKTINFIQGSGISISGDSSGNMTISSTIVPPQFYKHTIHIELTSPVYDLEVYIITSSNTQIDTTTLLSSYHQALLKGATIKVLDTPTGGAGFGMITATTSSTFNINFCDLANDFFDSTTIALSLITTLTDTITTI